MKKDKIFILLMFICSFSSANTILKIEIGELSPDTLETGDSLMGNSSKEACVSNSRMNVLYISRDNPLNIITPNHDRFLIKALNGTLIKEQDKYFIRPKYIGRCTIFLYSLDGQKIGEFEFRVKRLPDFYAGFNKNDGGEISKEDLNGIITPFTYDDAHFGYGTRGEIISFKVLVLKYEGSCDVFYCDGNKLSKELKDVISTLNIGDNLLFFDITCKFFASEGGRVMDLPTMKFVISDYK